VRNLYKVLGIAASADDQRIKTAFRNRAKETHPDLNPGSKYAEEQFRELLQAYEVLRDAHARSVYDAHLAQRRRETVRRLAHNAAVMVATFLLTTTSAFVVLGQQGISVHSETWQIATAWLTSVEVEPNTTVGQVVGASAHPSATAARAPVSVRSRKPETEAAAVSTHKKTAAATPKSAPTAERRTEAHQVTSSSDSQANWSWPVAAEPFFGLGASGLR
jgi:curved DNA-binding protein CbpA